ncbi:hypothetical protein EZV62_006875 [Acer yangbiense]|uniref:Sodium/calcium exchanger membrane region domain-containing protein n=1 Tax=Acer yangbiense TaxID=1000413 RepID=A0A5C7I8C3_9ROSI|nr:hypothetical protein EZV62_006875 [Acer yangbiense]
MAFSSFLKTSSLLLTLLFSLFFFLFLHHSPPPHHRRSLLSSSNTTACSSNENDDDLSIYLSFHYCLLNRNPLLSISLLSFLSLLFFYLLIKTASSHFSVVTTQLSSLLHLSPSMAAVTLLALGNGSPDVFSSAVALRSGHYRTGFGAILSAGAFVSAFVVGFVAIHAAPFGVDAACFVRDVGFYLVSALFLFYVYLSGEIFLWQSLGFVAFYVFFVGVVFWMDLGMSRGEKKSDMEMKLTETDCEVGVVKSLEERQRNEGFGFGHVYGKSMLRMCFKRSREHIWTKDGICGLKSSGEGISNDVILVNAVKVSVVLDLLISKAWEVPVTVLLKLTIPETAPSEWNRLYSSANIVLCPLLLLYACNSFMPLDHPVSFLLTGTHFPLWFIVFLASSSIGLLHFIVEKEPPKTEQMPVVVIAFVMSVFWISTIAGELLNCLAAIGAILELPSAILGLTVLAWGNSVGDLVADVAVAKAGHPAMAMAGCFAGPMFNMLVGLGSALVIQTGNVYPNAYELHFHTGIIIAFVFLLLSLMGSLLVITWSRFRVPRFWGFCLVGLYVVFTAVSLVIAMFSG